MCSRCLSAGAYVCACVHSRLAVRQLLVSAFTLMFIVFCLHGPDGGSVAEWLACWTQAQKGLGSNRSRDAVG